MTRRHVGMFLLLAPIVAAASGCSTGVNTSYGRSRGNSINGTGAFAGLVRDQGHQVRSAVRLSDDLGRWAEVIVRFAPYPGAPAKDEAEWYGRWLDADGSRRLVYIPCDYDAAPDYWNRSLEQLPPSATERTRTRIREAIDQATHWPDRLPPFRKEPAAIDEWFKVNSAATKSGTSRAPAVCRTLGGPWARGVDASKAAIVRDDTLKADDETVLLTGDRRPLVMTWTRPSQSRVLVVANGSFLLNAALATHPARASLARRVAAWVGDADDTTADDTTAGDDSPSTPRPTWPRRVAFVEGGFVNAAASGPPSVFDLLRVDPFGMVAAQLLALGLAACLARAPRLGRARPEAPTDADRPVAHPEALGALLARTGQTRDARAVLDTYRRWRNGPGPRAAP